MGKSHVSLQRLRGCAHNEEKNCGETGLGDL